MKKSKVIIMGEECTSYDIFGIDEKFSQELIMKVYNKLIFTYHPDRATDEKKDEFRNKMFKIQDAYEELLNNSSGWDGKSLSNTNLIELIIYDVNKNKLSNANIEINNNRENLSNRTTKNCNTGGIFLDLPDGEYTIQITKEGYTSQKLKQSISEKNKEIIVELLEEKSDAIKKYVPTEIKGSFKNLDKAIKESDDLTLNEDIILSDDEQEQFKNGIIIDKSIIIDGKGHDIDAQDLVRIFQVKKNGKLKIKNLTLKNGHAKINGGAIRSKGDVIIISNCNFINNTANENGGAITILLGGNIIIGSNCTFTNNTAKEGGVILSYGNVIIGDNSNFTNNTANENGGAISLKSVGIIIGNCNFIDNTATTGGAIYSLKSINIGDNCNFTNNTANKEGGAIYSPNSIDIGDNSNFTNNTATKGGAIHSLKTIGIGDNSNFTNNVARDNGRGDGGAIYSKSVVIGDNCNFTNNTVDDGRYKSEFFNEFFEHTGLTIYSESVVIGDNCNFTKNQGKKYKGNIIWY
jgi:predicted outer membrane repeat protein